ncbi:toll/interleukin-1 receptor domain-containing protein [Alteromonas sp. 14N.309.X.WAT.G.H12]|uniref:toll/interleukin-1 receptor domain-containing protein n=1 Tax=Alteromonas sp. 14N.309.X.WAT.G.H12 TaxID=3120824 RepID=UPI002FD6B4C9
MSAEQTTPPMYDAFISYASQNQNEADELCRYLEGQGLSCWIASRNVRPSRDYSEEIIEGVVNSKSLILLLSEHVENSIYVKREVERATSYNRKVFTIRLEEVAVPRSLELFLGLPHWVDKWAPDYPQKLEAIVAEINNTNVDMASIPGPSFIARISRFTKQNMLGVISTAILLFFAITFFIQWPSSSNPPTALVSIQDVDADMFAIKVTRAYSTSPIMLSLDGFSEKLMMNPAVHKKQFEIIFEFDNGQHSKTIQNLTNAKIKIDDSLPAATQVSVTLHDLEKGITSDKLTFSTPQIALLMNEGERESTSKLKEKLTSTQPLKCNFTLNYASGLMLCQIGQFPQFETYAKLQTTVKEIAFGYGEDQLDSSLHLDPIETKGDLAVHVDEKGQLIVLVPRLSKNLFYQFTFTDGDKSSVKKTQYDGNATFAHKLISDDKNAPALYLSNAMNIINKVIAPVSSKQFSQISWSQYPGVDNTMGLNRGFFISDDINANEIAEANEFDVTYIDNEGDKATYHYRFAYKEVMAKARLDKIKSNPTSLINCNGYGCRFAWLHATQDDIDLIDDIYIGFDARQMLSISNDDMAPLIAHMETNRQHLYEKEKSEAPASSGSSLSFGTPVNSTEYTLLQRLSEPSTLQINSTWKKRHSTRTSPILNFSWPVSPLFIQIAWKDGTVSKPLIYRVPFQ